MAKPKNPPGGIPGFTKPLVGPDGTVLVPPTEEERKGHCASCGEEVQDEALYCEDCAKTLSELDEEAESEAAPKVLTKKEATDLELAAPPAPKRPTMTKEEAMAALDLEPVGTTAATDSEPAPVIYAGSSLIDIVGDGADGVERAFGMTEEVNDGPSGEFPDVDRAFDPSPPTPFVPRNPVRGAPKSPRAPHEGRDSLEATIGEDPDAWLAELEKTGDELFAARQAVAAQRAHLARLESEYGSIGNLPSLWDHQRKQLLSEIQEAERLRLAAVMAREADPDNPETLGKVKTKIVEAALDSFAHAHARYAVFLQGAKDQRREYEEGRAKLDELWAVVHHLEGQREYLVQRCRMVEERVRFARAQMGL